MIYLDETYGKVYYDKEIKAVYAKLIGFLSETQFKHIIEKELEAMYREKATRYLIDLTELKVMLPENQKHVQQYWIPKIKKAGVQQVAFLQPENVFGQVSMKAANVTLDGEMETAYFENMGVARNWLKNKVLSHA